MSTVSAAPRRVQSAARRRRRPLVAAWLVPLMVMGQFALFSGIPVVVALVRTFRNPELRRLRVLAVTSAAAYGTAVLLWLTSSERADSLSKSLHPATYAVLVSAGAAYAVALHLIGTRRRRSAR